MKNFRRLVLFALLSCAAAFGQIDATTQVKNLPQALAGTQPWAVGTFHVGIPASNKYLIKFITPTWSPAITITIPANCSGSSIEGAAASGTVTFTVAKNGSTICTGTVSASGTTATWTGTGSATTLTSGDKLTVQQGTADSTFGDVIVSIAGKR